MPFVLAEEKMSFLHATGAFFRGHGIYLDSVYVHCVVLLLVLPLLVSFFKVSFMFVAFLEALSEDHVEVQPGILLFPCSGNPLI
jgi:hypothetical protein